MRSAGLVFLNSNCLKTNKKHNIQLLLHRLWKDQYYVNIHQYNYYLMYLLKLTVITSIMQTWPLTQLYTIIELISLYNMVARNVGQLSWKIKLKCQPGGLIPFPNCSPSLQLDLAFDTLLILQKTIPENVQLKHPHVRVHLI